MIRPGSPRSACYILPGRTGANRDESWRNSSAFIHSRQRYGPDPVWGKMDHGPSRLCYGFRRFISGVAPKALRCVPVRPDTQWLCPGHRRQSPGVTTTSSGSRTAKPRCYTVAYAFQWHFWEPIIDMSFAMYRTQVRYQCKKEQHSSGREDR